jgi:hypothetical protein
MPDTDVGSFIAAFLVIVGLQLVGFTVSHRPASPFVRILLVGTVVVFLLVMPIWWAILAGIALTAAVLLFEPPVSAPTALAALFGFLLGFVAMVPVVYSILWTSQHLVGRAAILPALFGSAFVVSGLFFASLRSFGDSKPVKLLNCALFGASVCLFSGGVLSIVFWDAFKT